MTKHAFKFREIIRPGRPSVNRHRFQSRHPYHRFTSSRITAYTMHNGSPVDTNDMRGPISPRVYPRTRVEHTLRIVVRRLPRVPHPSRPCSPSQAKIVKFTRHTMSFPQSSRSSEALATKCLSNCRGSRSNFKSSILWREKHHHRWETTLDIS